MTGLPERVQQASGCEVRGDSLTRQLYATDASLYQIEPAAVAFPRNPAQTQAVIRAAVEAGLTLIPRGAGTGLVGGAIGEGLVLDLAHHQRQITDFNPEKRTVRVGPGVVLDQLNAFLRPHGLAFGPDVAPSSRATLGGMIANNSSGAHVPVYGTTSDHVRALDIILADGSLHRVDSDAPSLKPQRDLITARLEEYGPEIDRRLPPGLAKRWPGYGLDRWRRAPGNLLSILSGSEGTLAAIAAAELNLVPLPRRRALGILSFASVIEAMQATVELLDLQAAAIEHIDRILFDQTRGQLAFQAARDLLRLDEQPCEALLLVEFFDDYEDRLHTLQTRRLGLRQQILTDPREMTLVWELRKAGLNLLTGRAGSAKPVTGIEDTAVSPEKLPAYVADLQTLLQHHRLEACFYGHAATGLLHLRPVLDLHQPEDRRTFRQLADEVSALVRQYRGSLTGEHGVGLARTEYVRQHLGDALVELLHTIKRSFDPDGWFNPGKILDDGRYRLDVHLRMDSDQPLQLPAAPALAFAARDGSWVANLEQCNGCGGCLKETAGMCPTFPVTREELLSTRGRANAIRAALQGRLDSPDNPLLSHGLHQALESCLACKACATECPSNVNLPLLKAELLHAQHQRHGLSLRHFLLSHADTLGQWGCLAPTFANQLLRFPWLRTLLALTLGLAPDRTLPPFAEERLDAWFARRTPPPPGRRGRVLLWDDTFVRYHEPEIGQAAVAVLEAAGFHVALVAGRACCGRPAFSQGHLPAARRMAQHNLRLLTEVEPEAPLLFLEPSCHSMFVDDYRELGLPEAGRVARRSFLFEEFLDQLLAREPDALQFRPVAQRLVVHAHCHTKALRHPEFLVRLLQRIPGSRATLLPTGCCGMAGAFGFLQTHATLSRQVAAPLLHHIAAQPAGTLVIASGTSCRHQIADLSPARPRHTAEWLAQALVSTRSPVGC